MTQDAQKTGERKELKSRYFGYKNAAAVTVGTVAVAALLLFGRGKPAPEPIQCPPQQPVAAEAAPVRGDNRCELDKGEADPRSANWDPASCGFCGDGIAQPWEQPSTAQPSDPRKYVCDVDFHCGNGRVDRNQAYTGLVQRSDGAFEFGSVPVNESCNPQEAAIYCAADCPAAPVPAPTGVGSTSRPPREPREGSGREGGDSPRTGGRASACSSGYASQVLGNRQFINRVTGPLFRSAGSLREALGAQGQAIDVSVSVRISESGVASVQGASARCGGGACPQSANVVSTSGLSLQGVTVTAPPDGNACVISVPAQIPAG